MRCRLLRRLVIFALGACALPACAREQRLFQEPALSKPAQQPANSALHPALESAAQASRVSRDNHYDENAWAVSEGKRYFVWFNCNGCHAQGGGSIGPALMDRTWRYGSDPQAIFASIVQGRPNGMPAFRGKIPEQQVWQLVAYVRALGGFVRLDVQPGRSDSLSGRPSEAMLKHRGTPEPMAERR
jgi:cytochrome c oxidase cbb3-type subunit 3